MPATPSPGAPGRPPNPQRDTVVAGLKELARTDRDAPATSLPERLKHLGIETDYSVRRLRLMWADVKKAAPAIEPSPVEPWDRSAAWEPNETALCLQLDLGSRLFLERPLTATEAKWAGRNRKALANLDPFFHWMVAREYAKREREAEAAGEPLRLDDLELLLAAQAWVSPDRSQLLKAVVDRKVASSRAPLLTVLADRPSLQGSLVSWLYNVLGGRQNHEKNFPSEIFNWGTVCAWRLDPNVVNEGTRSALERDEIDLE